MHSVKFVWSVNFDLIFSYGSRLIFGLIRCTGDMSPLIFESHDDPNSQFFAVFHISWKMLTWITYRETVRALPVLGPVALDVRGWLTCPIAQNLVCISMSLIRLIGQVRGRQSTGIFVGHQPIGSFWDFHFCLWVRNVCGVRHGQIPPVRAGRTDPVGLVCWPRSGRSVLGMMGPEIYLIW